MSSDGDWNDEARRVWNANAAHWDERMAEGNDFQRILIGPATERLLQVQPNALLVDAACGNGVMSRRLAELGAQVVGFDFSERLVELARRRSEGSTNPDYRVVDATDFESIVALGRGRFDGAVCNMAIMDMSAVAPLMRSMAALLKPGAPFVFSWCHPAFNQTDAVKLVEQSEVGREVTATPYLKLGRYLTGRVQRGIAMLNQPEAQPYFERPLSEVLGAAFAAGFVIDALEEPGFPREAQGQAAPVRWTDAGLISWDSFSEFPPVIIVRARVFSAPSGVMPQT